MGRHVNETILRHEDFKTTRYRFLLYDKVFSLHFYESLLYEICVGVVAYELYTHLRLWICLLLWFGLLLICGLSVGCLVAEISQHVFFIVSVVKGAGCMLATQFLCR
jgi:hypothetical protein